MNKRLGLAGMTRSNFADFGKDQQDKYLEQLENQSDNEEQSFLPSLSSFSSLAISMNTIQDSLSGVSNQLQELSGSIPEAGPLSAAFRTRVKHAIYLLISSVIFALLAIFIGLPTLIFRPAKFVICMTLSTLLGASSVIVLQKPSVFLSNLINGGPSNALPIVCLLSSLIATVYVTIVIHKYVFVLFMGSLQILCMLYYLSSFIPGGTRGLQIILKTGYVIVSTAITPCVFVCKKTASACMRRLLS